MKMMGTILSAIFMLVAFSSTTFARSACDEVSATIVSAKPQAGKKVKVKVIFKKAYPGNWVTLAKKGSGHKFYAAGSWAMLTRKSQTVTLSGSAIDANASQLVVRVYAKWYATKSYNICRKKLVSIKD